MERRRRTLATVMVLTLCNAFILIYVIRLVPIGVMSIFDAFVQCLMLSDAVMKHGLGIVSTAQIQTLITVAQWLFIGLGYLSANIYVLVFETFFGVVKLVVIVAYVYYAARLNVRTVPDVVFVDRNVTEYPTCTVCFDVVESGFALVPCAHIYHQDCIVKWFDTKRAPLCPICASKTDAFVGVNVLMTINARALPDDIDDCTRACQS